MVAGRANAQDEATPAPDRDDATIVLHAVNYAALSRDVLDAAMARVAMIYEHIGVRTAWVDDLGSARRREDGQLHLTVLLLSREMAEKKISAAGIKDGVLGLAHPRQRARVHLLRSHRDAPGAPTIFPDPARRRHRPRSWPSRVGHE